MYRPAYPSAGDRCPRCSNAGGIASSFRVVNFRFQANKKPAAHSFFALVLMHCYVELRSLCRGTALSVSRSCYPCEKLNINRLLLWHAQNNHHYKDYTTDGTQTAHGPPKQSHVRPLEALNSSGLVRMAKPGTMLSVNTGRMYR